ncbi:hypothetical protein [Sphingomonas sp. CV7422]|uniref:hypothetical protein n=1 Tax=Sphingomonas sp. CV7422 TaxID=3018036 RepID=UPI0022FE89C1|nr:hypothetical protein [Sphingomonas sp. CV7422]
MSAIDWQMSAILANVDRGGNEVPEVTNLADAVRAWLALDHGMQNDAVLRPEHPIMLDGERTVALTGQAIRVLADRLDG